MYNTCIYIHFVLCYIKHVLLVLMKSGHISSYEQTKKPCTFHLSLYIANYMYFLLV